MSFAGKCRAGVPRQLWEEESRNAHCEKKHTETGRRGRGSRITESNRTGKTKQQEKKT